MTDDWKQPPSLIYWDGPVDWRLFERAVFPARPGAVKIEIRKGIFKRVDRKVVPAASFEEANCLRVPKKVPWTGKVQDEFYLVRPRNDSEEMGVAKVISQMLPLQGDSPEEKWRREYISLLRKKKRVLEKARPGAVDYHYYRMMDQWHVVFSCHWEVEEVPELTQIEKDLQQLRDLFPGSKESGMAAFDDWLGDRCF